MVLAWLVVGDLDLEPLLMESLGGPARRRRVGSDFLVTCCPLEPVATVAKWAHVTLTNSALNKLHAYA